MFLRYRIVRSMLETIFYLLFPLLFYGIAIQQVLEITFLLAPWELSRRYRKSVSKVFSVLAGIGLAALTPDRYTLLGAPRIACVTIAGLATAAIAEAANATIKFLVYAKELRKSEAANGLSTTGSISLEAISRK